MPTIDNLQIEINAKASKANDAIDKLVSKLDTLTDSLNKVEGSKITGLANGVQRLSTAMQSMNAIKTSDFTRLASNLTKISNINVSSLNSASSSISHLTRAFNGLGTTSENAQVIGDMSRNISKLGNKSVQNAIANIPKLSTALNDLMTTLSKSPKVSENVIRMTNALANLSSQGSKVGITSRSIVNGLNSTNNVVKKSNKSFSGLASSMGKFYATYFLVIRGIKSLSSSIKDTADYIESFNYFNVAMKEIGKDWGGQYEKYGYENAESYAESFGKRLRDSIKDLSGITVEIGSDGKGLLSGSGAKNLGLNIKEITQYASQLASVTNSVGQTGEVSLAASKAFTKLAGDMSSLFNVDYSSVANNLQSGLIGQSRALYKYGIDITNATLQTYAYKLGLSKAVSEMTQAEKMQLRMIAILDQSKVAWGDLANTINSPSNMLRQFTNNLKETSMILGQLFIPILQKVMPVLNGVVIAIGRLIGSIAGLMGIKIDFSSFGQGTSGIEENLGGITDGLDNVAGSAKKARAGLRAFDELKVINMPDSSKGAGGAGGGGIDLTDKILEATQEYEKVWQEAFDKMQNRSEEWANKISNMLEPVMKIFKDFAIGDFFQAGQDVSNLVVSITDFFARAIDNVNWEGIGTKIGDFMAGIDWTKILSSVGNLIWQAIKAAIELWKGSFDAAPIETGILTAIGLLKWTSLGDELWKSMKDSADRALDFIGTKIGLLISGKLPLMFTTLLGTIMGLGPGMIGHIGVLLSNKLAGTIFDTSTWTGLPKIINDFMWEITYIIGDVVQDIVESLGLGIVSIGTHIFNFDEAGKYFEKAGEFFSKIKEDFEKKDWGAIGSDILLGILNGLTGALMGLAEPFIDLFNWTYESICDVFGIHSPAKEMEPLGKNILLGIVEGFSNTFESFTKSMKDFWDKYILPWFSSEKWHELGNGILLGLQEKWEEIKSWWSGTAIYQWWENDVKPWFSIDTWSEMLNNIKTSFKEKWDETAGQWKENITKWWSENVRPWFTKEKWLSLADNIKTSIKEKWESFTSWWQNTGFYKWWQNVSSYFSREKWSWSGIKEGLVSAWENAIAGIKQIWNNFANWLNEKLTFSWSAVNIAGKEIIPSGSITLGRLPTFEQGGFVEPNLRSYSLFIAGENGIPEIAGTVGGRTAVAGGAEITGIREEIRATSATEVQLLREQNQLLRALLDKEFGITKDEIGRAARSWAHEYSGRTGREAYSF